MTNKDFISVFIAGTSAEKRNGHLGFKGDYLVNYSTVIAIINRENKTARINKRKYSMTTSKIMSEVRYQLSKAGYTMTEFDGVELSYPWNYGYCGAGHTESSDVEYAIANAKRLGV